MVTDRYERPHGIQPASLTAALVLSAAMVGGLVMSSPAVQEAITKPFVGINIPLTRPPEPEPTAEVRPELPRKPLPSPIAKSVDTTPPIASVDPGPFVTPIDTGVIGATGSDPIRVILPPIATPDPVLTDPAVDPRYQRDFQPLYPAGEQRAEHTGRVTIRVLVGTDGRVKQVERIAADSDAFWNATQRQALGKWRFRPATRDGVAIEAWRTMTVRFEMNA